MKDAGFCIKLMEHLHMVPFSVVGWSEGSRTAIHVASQGKQYVKSMILLSAGSRVDYRGAGIFRGNVSLFNMRFYKKNRYEFSIPYEVLFITGGLKNVGGENSRNFCVVTFVINFRRMDCS
uniref:AB hydrolase-1 domain-containing protein n=1 Tax=Parascaris equorum TaxID=6256 RepID=A0A914R596_PAREQ